MSIDHDYAFAANSSKKLGSDVAGRPVQMQMGEHQMMGNQRYFRAFVQKAAPGAPGAQNATYMTAQGVRMVQHDANGQQRLVQMPPGGVRQVITNGGQQMIRTSVHQQQFHQQHPQQQQNYGHVGTIAGRSVVANGQMRTVQVQSHQQQFQQRGPNGSIIQQQQGQRVFVNQQQMGQVRYVQTQQQSRLQYQQGGPMTQQQQQMMQRNQQMQQQRAQMVHHQGAAPQMHQQAPPPPPQPSHQSNQQFYVPRGMNLAVPLREPSPEPIVKVEEPEVPPETSVKNEEPMPDASEIEIQIRNVVCNYTLPLHIDLRKLAMNTTNVTYEREKGVMMKQKRSPGCYIKVYSSGKVYIVGCRSEVDCKRAARSIARHVQRVMGKLNERVVIRNYRVNNVLATVRFPFGIKIEDVAAKYPAESTYEPELSVGLVWRSTTPKATLRIHTTGSITVTGAQSEADVMDVIEKIYDVVLEFRCQERAKGNAAALKKRKRKAPTYRGPPIKRERPDEGNYGNSGVINNQVYFSDEDADLYDDLDLDEEI